MSSFGSFSLLSLLSLFSLLLLSSSPSVLCHVSFSPSTATENAYTFFVMSVPHGCGANGTTKLIATFPPYITAITLERQVYYEMEKKQIVDPADGLTKWRCEWTGVSGVPALPHDQIQRLGFQVKTPVITNTGLVTTASGVKQMVMPVKQLCEGDTFSDWTITVTIVPAAGTATTTTPAPAGTTTTTASPSPHNHDDHDMVAASSWTSSDKLSVASLVLCSIMFISTLVLFHKSSYACMTISNDYNSNNNNNNTNSNTNNNNTTNNKHMSTNGTATKDVTIELEEKANANGAV